jgi:hypothetical protein
MRNFQLSEFTDEPEKRLLLGPFVAGSEKISDPDAGGASARRGVRLMQNKNVTVLIATEPPAITICTLIYLALVRHKNSGAANGLKKVRT